MKDFDIILGMDWFFEHYAFIDCRDKKVIFEILEKWAYYFEGIKSPTSDDVSTKITCVLVEAWNEGYLVSYRK